MFTFVSFKLLTIALLLGVQLCSAINPVLLHRYSFDDPAGSTTVADTADVSAWGGTQKNGLVVDTVTLGNGKATFTGQGYLRLPNNIMESSTEVTIEMWFTSSSSNTHWNRLFQFGANSDNTGITLNRSVDINGAFGSLMIASWLPNTQFHVISDIQFNSIASSSHIVAVYDPVVSATFKIYVNAVEVASASTTSALESAMGSYNYVGTGANGNSPERLFGVIDEFRIWRGALSATTIAQHYSPICPAGSYSSVGKCKACPQGTYGSVTPGIGNTCTQCEAGYSTAASGISGLDASACTVCAPGFSGSSVSGTSGCAACPRGTYGSVIPGNGNTCTACQAGYTTSSAGTAGKGFFVQIVTSSGTWVVPSGVDSAIIYALGGGGGGCGDACGGGSGGGASVATVSVTAGQVAEIIIGAGGTGTTTPPVIAQSRGGDTRITLAGTTIIGGGGSVEGGTGSGGSINLRGGTGSAFNKRLNGGAGESADGIYFAAGGGGGMQDAGSIRQPGGAGGGSLAGDGGYGAPQYPISSPGGNGALYGGGGGGGGNYQGRGGAGAAGVASISYSVSYSASVCICPNGFQSMNVSGTSKCTRCPDGTSSQAGYACGACGVGSYWLAGVCEPCPAGKYNPRKGEYGCIDCGAGKASDAKGAASSSICEQCYEGQFSLSGSRECTPCSEGFFAKKNSSACRKCPAGTHVTSDQRTCEECRAGTSSAPGAVVCMRCAAGYYAHPGSAQCTECAAGTYSPHRGASACTPCPKNTYSLAGATACYACHKGYFSRGGATGCETCST